MWPKLHRHSNITSNHCSSFQTTLNSPCGLYGLIWARGAWLGPWGLYGGPGLTPRTRRHLSQHSGGSLSPEEKGGFPACGDNEMWSPARPDNAVSLPCLLTIWPLPVTRCLLSWERGETIRGSHHRLPVTQQQHELHILPDIRCLMSHPHTRGWENSTHFICLVNNLILIYWVLGQIYKWQKWLHMDYRMYFIGLLHPSFL